MLAMVVVALDGGHIDGDSNPAVVRLTYTSGSLNGTSEYTALLQCRRNNKAK